MKRLLISIAFLLIASLSCQAQTGGGLPGIIKVTELKECPTIQNAEISADGILTWKSNYKKTHTVVYQVTGKKPMKAFTETNSLDIGVELTEKSYVYAIIAATCQSGVSTYYLYSNDPDAKVTDTQIINLEEIEQYCCSVCEGEGCACDMGYCYLLNMLRTNKKSFDTNLVVSTLASPNPFQDNTTITYELNDPQREVNLVIYNVEGKKITTLINKQFQTEGIYQANWDASSFPKGIYYYVLNVGQHTQQEVGKLIKLK